MKDLAQALLLEQSSEGQLVGVPAPVHVSGDRDAELLRMLHQRPGLVRRRGKGLVDNDRQPRVERSVRQGHMDFVRGRHHHEVVGRGALEDLLRV